MPNNNEPVVRAMVAEYQRGETLEAIGRRHGMSLGAVRARLLARGVRLRAPGRRPLAATSMRSRPT